MNFCVIGLGSMGKRRIRNLQFLGYKNIIGIDPREDRRIETKKKYGIEVYKTIDDIKLSNVDAIIISVPPDRHLDYIKIAVDNKKPSFVEAGVISEDTYHAIKYNVDQKVYIAPSCTLFFHPVIKDIYGIVKSQVYGKITNFSYHSGQYLPDWHPWESIKDFYVSNRLTGGAREIVPFELSWLTKVIGYPQEIKGFFQKTIEFGADIEDTYTFVIKYADYSGTMLVDVVSRFATRSLILNLEKAQIRWNWEDGYFKLYESENNRWIQYNQPDVPAEPGYNKNITELMYINEMKSFIEGIDNPAYFPNTLEEDYQVLQLLDKIELSEGGFTR